MSHTSCGNLALAKAAAVPRGKLTILSAAKLGTPCRNPPEAGAEGASAPTALCTARTRGRLEEAPAVITASCFPSSLHTLCVCVPSCSTWCLISTDKRAETIEVFTACL